MSIGEKNATRDGEAMGDVDGGQFGRDEIGGGEVGRGAFGSGQRRHGAGDAGVDVSSGIAAGIARGVTRLFAERDISALTELSLKSGRRVDVIGIARDGLIHVVEIKSCRADFRCDHKWPEYLEFADFFYFAVSADFPLQLLPEAEGLIIADRFGGEIVRAARHRPLPAARRKAMTLRFARTAAGRLMLPLLDPTGPLPAQLE